MQPSQTDERFINEYELSDSIDPGGASGIGRAVANKLAALGIHVIVVGRDVERGKRRSQKSARREAKRISYPPIFEMPKAHANLPEKRSSSETVMSIF